LIIKSIIEKELERNISMQKQYQDKIDKLPKGSLTSKKNYYYLQYRIGKRVVTDYVGKRKEGIQEKIEKRKHFKKMLYELKSEHKAILKVLEGLK